MVLCNVECVQKISQYLGLPPRKIYISENNLVASDGVIKDQSVEGFSTIVQALVKDSKKPDALGRDKMEKALTRQWLEYAVLYLNYADLPANSRRIFKELNSALQRNTYICGTNETIADIALYYCLHSIMVIARWHMIAKKQSPKNPRKKDCPTKRKRSISMSQDGLTIFNKTMKIVKNWIS